MLALKSDWIVETPLHPGVLRMRARVRWEKVWRIVALVLIPAAVVTYILERKTRGD